MATLLRGKNAEGKPDNPSTDPPPAVSPQPPRDKRVKPSLVAADVLLVTLTGYLVFNSTRPFGAFEVTLCIVAVGLGAWLTCLAIWKH